MARPRNSNLWISPVFPWAQRFGPLLAMVLWVPMLAGGLSLPTAFDPVSWHAHEFLFGYVSAVVGGFLLTAVPNWSGRLPVVGWPLAGLVGLWLIGRVAVMFSAGWPPLVIAILDLAGMVTLWAYLAREIILGRNWKNLVVLAILSVLILGNAVFHWEAAQGYYAASGFGLRIGLGAGIMLIVLIGGRIVPSFTRNWLVKARLPARARADGGPGQGRCADHGCGDRAVGCGPCPARDGFAADLMCLSTSGTAVAVARLACAPRTVGLDLASGLWVYPVGRVGAWRGDPVARPIWQQSRPSTFGWQARLA